MNESEHGLCLLWNGSDIHGIQINFLIALKRGQSFKNNLFDRTSQSSLRALGCLGVSFGVVMHVHPRLVEVHIFMGVYHGMFSFSCFAILCSSV